VGRVVPGSEVFSDVQPMQTINHRSGPGCDGCRRQAASSDAQSFIVRSPLAFCDSSVFICVIRGQQCDSIQPSPAFSNQTQQPRSNRDAKNAIRRRAEIYAMLTFAITGLARVIVNVKTGRSPAPVHCIVSICVLLRFCHAQFRRAFV
jgi:hypothetical protein